jgi:hypothetical protein
MMKMQQKKNQQNGQRNVMLTVSNALDQSEKQRIEVAGDVTIAQAVKDQGLAPTGSFDVFDAAGKVVSDVQARNLTDENVYVGVQRVAGGADWDAGWGAAGGTLEIEPATEVQDEAPGKGICFVSAFNENSRNTVIPAEQDTVRACAESSGLTPRDGSAWDVFDDMGRVVTDVQADGLVGKTLWISPAAIGGGMSEFSRAGLSDEEIDELRVMYPMIQGVKHMRLPSGHCGSIVMNIVGVHSSNDDTSITYRVLIDLREFPLEKPNAYVLSPDDEDIFHCNIYHAKPFTILANREICAICDGSEAKTAFDGWRKNRMFRIRAWLNHLQSVLSNPNSKDPARSA